MKLILMPEKRFLLCSSGHTPFLLWCNSEKPKLSDGGLLEKFFVKKVKGYAMFSFLEIDRDDSDL